MNLAIHVLVTLFVKTIKTLNLRKCRPFEITIKKLIFVVHVLWTTQNLVISRCCFAEDSKEMFQKNIDHRRAHPLFCS